MIEQAMRGVYAMLIILFCAMAAQAAPYAAFVMDARSGKVLFAENADRRLHPASLTKMMTLYVVFREIDAGRLSLDKKVTVSRYVAAKPASKLGLKTGQRITIRDLIRATAVKSANDAAAALAEAVSGSEKAFGVKMTETARAMGMTRTTFRNASGLTQQGHLSTARDMANLGRRLFYDYPQYYNLFSRITTTTMHRSVYNTNRRFLRSYNGADGIKTGYTVAAGYNLVASARRGNERIIAAVFGGKSTAGRNAQMAKLLDLGFRKAPSRVAIVRPAPLHFAGAGDTLLAKSRKPRPRPGLNAVAMARNSVAEPESVAAAITSEQMAEAVAQALESAMREDSRSAAAVSPQVPATAPRPKRRLIPPTRIALAQTGNVIVTPAPETDAGADTKPAGKPPGSWSVQLGAFPTRNQAERLLLTTALQDLEAFDGAIRTIEPTRVKGAPMYRARFVGLSKSDAQNACARLKARASDCLALSPGS